MTKFEGIYSDLRLGALTSVRADADGTLTVSNSAGVHKELKQEGELIFVDDEGVPMAFQIDVDGNVEYLKYDNPVSYSSKVPEAHAFSDVPKGHPYELYINGLHSLGIVEDSLSGVFGVIEPVTRGQFVHEIIREFGIPGSDNKPTFKDIGNSPYRSEIQAAAEIGLLTGTGQQLFQPDRPIRREEAAAIVERLLFISGYQAKESSTELTSGTSEWAENSVRTVIDLKLHGPEVLTKEGRADYGSERELTKQEMAAIMYLLLLPEVSLLQ